MYAFFDKYMHKVPEDVRRKACCVHQTAPNSEFIDTLNKNFRHCRVKLLSLAAGNPLPLPVGRVVELESSHLGETSTGHIIYNEECTPRPVVPGVDHLSIIEIYNENPTFCKILPFFGNKC